LALIPISSAKLSSTSATGPSVEISENLREALDHIVLNGGAPVPVTDAKGKSLGSISVKEISSALGADVSSLGIKKGK
jgi:osmoprotectant transport system ATP-binding protein